MIINPKILLEGHEVPGVDGVAGRDIILSANTNVSLHKIYRVCNLRSYSVFQFTMS